MLARILKQKYFSSFWTKRSKHFCSNNKETIENNTEKSTSEELKEDFSDQQKHQIQMHEIDKSWNTFLQIDQNHNFQKSLIVSRKEFEKSTKQLRSAILFEDLLKTELKILIYDTKGKPFYRQMLILLYAFGTIMGALWVIFNFAMDQHYKVLISKTTEGKVFKYSVYFMCIFLGLGRLLKFRKFQKRYVEKIIYSTQSENFIITKRKLWGTRYDKEWSRFKIVYTENEALNRIGTNYFQLNTTEQFSIGYRNAWIKQDLFSHLISQRIRL